MRDIYDASLSLSNVRNSEPIVGSEGTIKLVEEFEQQDPRVTFLSTFPVSSFVKQLALSREPVPSFLSTPRMR